MDFNQLQDLMNQPMSHKNFDSLDKIYDELKHEFYMPHPNKDVEPQVGVAKQVEIPIPTDYQQLAQYIIDNPNETKDIVRPNSREFRKILTSLQSKKCKDKIGKCNLYKYHKEHYKRNKKYYQDLNFVSRKRKERKKENSI